VLGARRYRCGVFVSDLRHFLDMPDDAPVPAKRLGLHLTAIVRTATQHARASTTLDIYAHYTQPADQRASDTLANILFVHR